ncbi:hypothetical protein G4228_002179 [Cervus hanglu yarkandensis]|nr:hypothetical protein G4228_002179 [Cervus hanglu yarkandensis]
MRSCGHRGSGHDDLWHYSAVIAGPATGTSQAGLGCTQHSEAGSPTSPAHSTPDAGELAAVKSGRLDRALMELSGRWGPVFTVWLGPRPAVVLCGYAALRDALVLQADAFSGRGAMAVFERFTRGNAYDLIMFPPLGAPFERRQLLDNAVSNVICSMVFGNRYGNEDMEFLRLLDLFNDNFRIMSSRWGENLRNFAELRVSIPQQIQLHQQTQQPGKPRDFIDSFLDQIDKEQKNLESHFEAETLVMMTQSLLWRYRDHKHHPELWTPHSAQIPRAKVQAELDDVVGLKRASTLDRERLPYTNAVLREIQRFISMVAFGPPRALTFVATSCRRKVDVPGCRPGPNLTSILLWFCLLPVGSRSDTDLTPQCPGLSNVPPAFQLRLVAC